MLCHPGLRLFSQTPLSLRHGGLKLYEYWTLNTSCSPLTRLHKPHMILNIRRVLQSLTIAFEFFNVAARLGGFASYCTRLNGLESGG